MGSGFHSSYISEKNGFKVWGESMANNGTGHLLAPAIVNSTTYPALTGTVYYMGIGSNYAGFVQLIVLTSTGLFASGDPGIVLSTGIKNTTSFSKLTVNGKSDGLPAGITPDSVKMMFVTHRSILITTCGGRVFALSQDANMRGAGGGGSINAWSQVMRSAGVPLDGIIATRGTQGKGFALAADSTLWTWGGQTLLGDGSNFTNRAWATKMTNPAGISGIKMIQATQNTYASSAGMSYYVLGTNGRVYSLGANDDGQLGDSSTTTRLTWVNAKNSDGTILTDAMWISATEHDPSFANLGVVKYNMQTLTCGNNSMGMIGRINGNAAIGGAINHMGIPNGLAATDSILFCEIGGHTSAFVKYKTNQYGYIGHAINGSMGSSGSGNLSTITFNNTPAVDICGTFCDTPEIYIKPYLCSDSQFTFVIKGRAGSKVKYQLNNSNVDSLIINLGDSSSITVNNTSVNQSLKILQIQGILCNLTFNVNDTVKYNPKKDSFLTICKNQPIIFNGILRDTSGIYRDTFINNKGCDSFLILHLTVNDTTKKDSFLSICRYQPITFNGQTLTVSGIYKDTLTNALGCDSFLYLYLTVNDSSRKDSFMAGLKIILLHSMG